MRLMTLALTLACTSLTQADDADLHKLAGDATTVLKTHCYRCHGQDGAIDGDRREARPAGGDVDYADSRPVAADVGLRLRQLTPVARTAFCRSALLGAPDFPSWVFDALLDREVVDQSAHCLMLRQAHDIGHRYF